MADYTKVTELIRLYSDFEKDNPSGDFSEFGRWLSCTIENSSEPKMFSEKRKSIPPDNMEHFLDQHLRTMHKDKPLNVQVAILIGRLNKFSRMYIKKAYGDDDISLTLDEFQFLATAASINNPRKTDIITLNIFEATTGTEILKRLIKLNYLKQAQSKDDKRSKIISLTTKGEKVLWSALGHMKNIGNLITANLDQHQLNRLLEILEYLNDFHARIFLNHKEESIQSIIKNNIKN